HEVLVDIGCGSGEMLEAGRDRFARCVGFDTNRPLIRHIAAQGRAVAIEGHFDAGRIPGELRGRPTVFALSHVLEHLPEPAGLLAQVAAAMGPGDLLYVEVPLHTGESFRRQGYGWNLWNAEHLALYGPRTLGVLAGRAGLAVLDSGSRIFARGSRSTKTRLRLLRRAPAAFLRAALTKPRRLSIADVMVADYGYAVLRKP
ncbi:MAG: class I SAM-dependent methyltransferase, partial [Rhodocyclaceae bacterium]|nr:class I SAM-dependent methyltransferase [Rhodocyclaceae bacterium]